MKTTPIRKTFLLFQSLRLQNGKIYPNLKFTQKYKKLKKRKKKKSFEIGINWSTNINKNLNISYLLECSGLP